MLILAHSNEQTKRRERERIIEDIIFSYHQIKRVKNHFKNREDDEKT
jgi:hypothetical protein